VIGLSVSTCGLITNITSGVICQLLIKFAAELMLPFPGGVFPDV